MKPIWLNNITTRLNNSVVISWQLFVYKKHFLFLEDHGYLVPRRRKQVKWQTAQVTLVGCQKALKKKGLARLGLKMGKLCSKNRGVSGTSIPTKCCSCLFAILLQIVLLEMNWDGHIMLLFFSYRLMPTFLCGTDVVFSHAIIT